MNIIFAGTPEIAATALAALCSRYSVSLVMTMPDRPAGRGKKLESSPVKQYAEKQDIPVITPTAIDSETLAIIRKLEPDLIVVVAYGLIFPSTLLIIPRQGCWNIHYSLLPRWRGAAPVQRAIEAGDQKTGVAIMQMNTGLDTGDILWQLEENIDEADTSETLTARLATLGAEALLQALNQQELGKLQPRAQNTQHKTYARKLTKEEGLIQWALPAEKIERQIRAFQPWPVSHSNLAGEIIRIWKAQVLPVVSKENPGTIIAISSLGLDVATGSHVLRLLECQRPGKRPMPIRDLIHTGGLWKVGMQWS